MGFPFAPRQPLIAFSAIFGNADDVYALLDRDVRLIEPQRHWVVERREVTLDDCFMGYPEPGAGHLFRVIAFAPAQRGPIIQTANLQDGWGSLAYRLSANLQIRVLQFRFCQDDFWSPSRGFSVIDSGREIRSVSVYKDGKRWSFIEQGDRIPEEDASSYNERVVAERLTNDNLVTLARKLGVPLGDTRAHGSGILIREAA